MCGSGLKAVMLADQAIRTNSAGVVIAGGTESMSNAPYLIPKGLSRFGHKRMIDSMIHDGLWDAYNDMHMGNCAEMLATKRNYSRRTKINILSNLINVRKMLRKKDISRMK